METSENPTKQYQEKTRRIEFDVAFKDIPTPGKMPSPPEFLLKVDPETGFAPFVEEHRPAGIPKNIDYILYQNALNDRNQAEISYAEIYAQYLEVVNFNQKLLRKIHSFERFKSRMRGVYDRAHLSDDKQNAQIERLRRHLSNTEKTLNDSELEKETLKASVQAHEDAFQQILAKLGQAESQMEHANHQFQTLAEEFDNRGLLLEESSRSIQNYTKQMDLMSGSIKEWQEKHSRSRDENLIIQSQIRDIQLREAGVAALNSELTTSVTSTQKRIYELEDQLSSLKDESQKKMALMATELDTLREQRRVEALLQKTRKFNSSGDKFDLLPLGNIPNSSETSKEGAEPRQQWNEFYDRWSHIINELTTHSGSLIKKEIPQVAVETSQLVSEAGDLEIL